MKTLVIHPKDVTTDFLSEIYKDKDWTIINTNISKSEMKKQIISHDRIVMLGHGTERGLLGFGRFVIDSTWVYLLRDKECVCIWCNADKFVKRYGLKGFYTGMIISEYEEAIAHYITTDLETINKSNTGFALAIKNSINEDNMLEKVKMLYEGDSNVVHFNRNHLYFQN